MIQHFNKNMEINYTWDTTLEKQRGSVRSLIDIVINYYMACVCSRYNAHSDWLIVTEL